jgi:hypothetical protein
MANKQLFANDALTTLGSSLSSGATTMTVSTGTGALYPSPNPSLGQFFLMTLWAAGSATLSPNEIVAVTNRSGDTMIIVRAQEGTTALAWSAGDNAQNLNTAGTMANLAQQVDVQQQAGNEATEGGSANAGTITLSPAPVSLAALTAPVHVLKAEGNNTGAYTLNPNGLGATAVVYQGAALLSGDLPNDQWFTVMYNPDGGNFQLLSPPGNARSGPPTGAVGGVLAGTLPNPGFAQVAENSGAPLLLGVPPGSSTVTPVFNTPAALGISVGVITQFTSEEPSGTINGESLVAGSWTTRFIDSQPVVQSWATLVGGGVMQLAAGTYVVSAFAGAIASTNQVSFRHKLRLYNDTASVTLISGLNNEVTSTGEAVGFLQGQFTLSVTSNIELDSWVNHNAFGGNQQSTGEIEVYVDITFQKVA